MIEPKTNNYDEVMNDYATYIWIAQSVLKGNPVIIPWVSKESMTALSIMFVYKPVSIGKLHRGLSSNDLFVCIMSKGGFGFEVHATGTTPDYYEEKLGGGFGKTLSNDLCTLINNVKKCITIGESIQ